ncbi:MAG TPA: hypothetical protein DCE80_14365 [Ignavibacteriales bacterium]|nr:hypothetical protein [Ignavibacteriales bacterium]
MLNANALCSVEELKNHLEIAGVNIQTAFLSLYNSSADATGATFQVTATTLILVVTGGANAGTSTLTFADADKDTLGELVTAINGLGKGWVANSQGLSSADSTDLTIKESTSCLLIADQQVLYGANNARLETYINSTSSFLERECDRSFHSATYTNEEYNGNGRTKFWLKQYPITSITSLTFYDRYNATTLYEMTEDKDYYADLNTGRLDNLIGVWTKDTRNIRVTYVAGYTTIPEDLKVLCMDIIDFQITKKRMIVAQGLWKENAIVIKETLPKNLQLQIQEFKRIVF